MDYTPIPPASSATQVYSIRKHTEHGTDTALSSDHKAGGVVELQEVPIHAKDFRPDLGYNFPHTNEISNYDHTAGNMDPKPFLLHQSMWLWEIVSLTLAFALLAAVVAMLIKYDGKRDPLIAGLTLNTVIAAAATLFRICLMVPVSHCMCQLTWVLLQKDYKPLHDIVKIDAASRGPLGSLGVLKSWHRYAIRGS
jgi:hypothetical protein